MTFSRACAQASAIGVASLALIGTAWAADGARSNASERCGDVVVQFKPEGSGGAHDIKASGIKCEAAREVARSCVKGEVREGWTVVTWTKTVMTKGEKRIVYTPVGGGGCGEFPRSCDDFSYRGVGFFGMQVLGAGCGKGKDVAKTWYDTEACGFGDSCDVGNYRCRGNTSNGTVTCKRENGYRIRWQMGE